MTEEMPLGGSNGFEGAFIQTKNNQEIKIEDTLYLKWLFWKLSEQNAFQSLRI